MVCQAATQTRFRALKHLNGIAGNATIIVRVIACFQPLQDCQAEYFRALLKPVTRTISHCPFPLGAIFMGENSDPWQLHNFNHVSNVGEAPNPAKQNTNSMVFPTYVDPCGFFHLNSSFMPPSNPTRLSSGQKRFMIFDQSGDKTGIVYRPFATQILCPNSTEAKTNVSNGNANEEIHEDTEEIDALLYSDSDHHDYEEEEEEEASTGHSPINMAMLNLDNEEDEQVTSSAVLQPLPPLPAKRRRVDLKLDPSLEDTASSTRCGNEARKKAKREKIQETVGVLRRIIPGGKGKDAASVLDEAIKYLRSLRLKAKGLGVVSTLK